MKVTHENGLPVYDKDFVQARAYGKRLAAEINLDLTEDKYATCPGWPRSSKRWIPEEDHLLLRLKTEFWRHGTAHDVELCIAHILGRTTVSVRNRIQKLIKPTCTCCGK